jgi:hypothetical protein
MLGEQIAEERLKIVSRRVINVEGGIPKIETSTTGEGNYRGTKFKQTSTFWTIPSLVMGRHCTLRVGEL